MFKWLKSKLLSIPGSFGAVVNKQIAVYLELKKQCSKATENEMLNELLASRIKTYSILPSEFLPEKAELYYKPLSENDNKTLDDVIFDIVIYEFVHSRQTTKHPTMKELAAFESTVERYISDQIEQRVAQE